MGSVVVCCCLLGFVGVWLGYLGFVCVLLVWLWLLFGTIVSCSVRCWVVFGYVGVCYVLWWFVVFCCGWMR